MTRPGTVPLSDLHTIVVTRWLQPEAVADAGPFYIRDGYTRPWLIEGHQGTQVVYVVDFLKGNGDAVRFALVWSPMREQVVELVLRAAAVVGPCRLVSKPMRDGMNIWCIVGVSEAGEVIYDPLHALPESETSDVPFVTL